jgi:hypothetical protein
MIWSSSLLDVTLHAGNREWDSLHTQEAVCPVDGSQICGYVFAQPQSTEPAIQREGIVDDRLPRPLHLRRDHRRYHLILNWQPSRRKNAEVHRKYLSAAALATPLSARSSLPGTMSPSRSRRLRLSRGTCVSAECCSAERWRATRIPAAAAALNTVWLPDQDYDSVEPADNWEIEEII